MKYLQDQQGPWEFYISRNTASLDGKQQRIQNKTTGAPKFYWQVAASKITQIQQAVPSMEKRGNQRTAPSCAENQDLRGWAQEPRA